MPQDKILVASKIYFQDGQRVKSQNEGLQYTEQADLHKKYIGWFRFDAKEFAYPNSIVIRLTQNEASYRKELGQVGDRTLVVMLQAKEYAFATYTFATYTLGIGRIDVILQQIQEKQFLMAITIINQELLDLFCLEIYHENKYKEQNLFTFNRIRLMDMLELHQLTMNLIIQHLIVIQLMLEYSSAKGFFGSKDIQLPQRKQVLILQAQRDFVISGWLQSKRSGSIDQLQIIFRFTINPSDILKDK